MTIAVSLILFAVYLTNRNIYFWQIATIFVPVSLSFGLGSWLVFTWILAKTFSPFVPVPFIIAVSVVFFCLYFFLLFLKYLEDFQRNRDRYSRGIQYTSGIINPSETNFYNPKIGEEQIEKSPFVLPLKLLVWVGLPIGAGGCGLLMRHAGESVSYIVLAIIMYCGIIVGIFATIQGYFSLYILAGMQIKYRTWFRLKD